MNAYGQLKLWYANSEIRTPSLNPATFNQFTYDSYIITVSRVYTVPFFFKLGFLPHLIQDFLLILKPISKNDRRHINPLISVPLLNMTSAAPLSLWCWVCCHKGKKGKEGAAWGMFKRGTEIIWPKTEHVQPTQFWKKGRTHRKVVFDCSNETQNIYIYLFTGSEKV